jgi:hypothetical protein
LGLSRCQVSFGHLEVVAGLLFRRAKQGADFLAVRAVEALQRLFMGIQRLVVLLLVHGNLLLSSGNFGLAGPGVGLPNLG